MKHLLCAALAASALAHGAMAHAADGPIQISTTIPYKDGATASTAIRAECKWNTELSAHIVKNAKGLVATTDADLATLPGKTLQIVVTHAHALGGGGFTGPKWGRIYGELKENGKVLGHFDLQRNTGGRGAMSACGALSKVADALGEDVAEWVQNPKLDPVAAAQ